MKRLALLLLLAACGRPNVPEPVLPAATAPAPPPAPPGPDPWKLPPREASAPAARPARAISLAKYKQMAKALPATCAAYGTRTALTPAPGNIDEALLSVYVEKRDGLLVALEAQNDAAKVVRADVAPVECADAIADPVLAKLTSAEGEQQHALLGLSLAAKLARTAQKAPVMPAGADKAKVKAFIGGPLKTWVLDQARSIELLSVAASDLVGYGLGVAAVEAGTADLRLVDTIRSAPVPKEWDPELRAVYEASLDEALEPRKARGRDAALVGLGELARAGALNDIRVYRARMLLAKLYGGRRIDALDALLVPRPDLTENVPSSYWRHVKIADGTLKISPRAHFEAGRLYWERSEFIEAAYGYKDAKTPDERLLLANALALASGPANAAEMMHGPFALTQTDALDALSTEGADAAGAAAYDAAHLRALATMGAPGATPLKDIALRFDRAATLLRDPAQKQKAADRAADARAAGQ